MCSPISASGPIGTPSQSREKTHGGVSHRHSHAGAGAEEQAGDVDPAVARPHDLTAEPRQIVNCDVWSTGAAKGDPAAHSGSFGSATQPVATITHAAGHAPCDVVTLQPFASRSMRWASTPRRTSRP